MSSESAPSETVTRKPDADVAETTVGGGHQTAQQAEMTEQGPAGRSDSARNDDWPSDRQAGRNPTAIGGSSEGASDRKSARPDTDDQPVAAGRDEVEKQAD